MEAAPLVSEGVSGAPLAEPAPEIPKFDPPRPDTYAARLANIEAFAAAATTDEDRALAETCLRALRETRRVSTAPPKQSREPAESGPNTPIRKNTGLRLTDYPRKTWLSHVSSHQG